jgi:V/A-type H+-transporting ATPase subunit C
MDDYPYINARIRAMRADLLGAEIYDGLLGLPDIERVRDALGTTLYGKALGEAAGRVSIVVMEEGLRHEWLRAVQKLHGIANGRPGELLEILLGRWEAENLKAILRGKKADAGMTEIMAAVLPTGVMDEAALAELARQPSVQGVVDLLATWRSHYARPLRRVLKSQHELKELEPLELALDHYYFENAIAKLEDPDQNTRHLRQFMGLLIDRVNLLTAFKISTGGGASRSDVLSYFLPGGGDLPITVYSDMTRARNPGEMIEAARKTQYLDILQALERERRGVPASAWLERELDRFVLKKARAMGLSDPLGIGLMISYLHQKYHEIGNLRIILRGKAYDMYPEDIRAMLVM